jgi:hypothetical protein
LIGYRKLESEEIPTGYNVTLKDDPYPVFVFGEYKTIPDNKIGKYINSEFNYYVNIYENNKLFGFPHKNWTEMPNWIIELHKMFSHIDREYENYIISKDFPTK